MPRKKQYEKVERIKKLWESGLAPEQIAEQVGVTDVTISRWESGQREPIASDFIKLCEVLAMELEWFIGKENGNNEK